GIACDAAMAPIVTGAVNVDALEDLVRLCVELDARRDGARDAAWAAIEQAVIGKAVDLLSGPGGLASFLRRRQLGARLGGPSLPLDIGYAESVPAGIRNAVLLRDRHCQWAGGCTQPAGACQVHHTKHKANGGKTSARPKFPPVICALGRLAGLSCCGGRGADYATPRRWLTPSSSKACRGSGAGGVTSREPGSAGSAGARGLRQIVPSSDSRLPKLCTGRLPGAR